MILIDGKKIALELREELKKQVSDLQTERGTRYCWKQLEKFDPQSAKNIHPNDTYRILRSLEVYLATGISIKKFQTIFAILVYPYCSTY